MLLRFFYRGLRARFRDQRAEIAALVSAVRPGEVAVDVGANKGAFLPWLSRAAGPGKVVAFEPQPVLAGYLRRACAAARLKNVVVEAVGVSDRRGRLTLRVPEGGRSSPGASFEPAVAALSPCREIVVPVTSLDEYFRGEPARVAAIKVDVEGHELSVFRGGEDVLARHSPLLVFECEERHVGRDGIRQTLRFLEERGYGGFFVWRSRLLPIGEFDPAVHQRRTGARFWDDPGYCNNFVVRRAGPERGAAVG